MTAEEIKKEKGVQIDVPDVDSWQEAMAFIFSGFAFLVGNYKKTTIALVVIVVFIIYQAVMNFQHIKQLFDLIPQ